MGCLVHAPPQRHHQGKGAGWDFTASEVMCSSPGTQPAPSSPSPLQAGPLQNMVLSLTAVLLGFGARQQLSEWRSARISPPRASGRWSPRPMASGSRTSSMPSWFAPAITRSPTYHWLLSQVSPASAAGWAGAAPWGFTQHPWVPWLHFPLRACLLHKVPTLGEAGPSPCRNGGGHSREWEKHLIKMQPGSCMRICKAGRSPGGAGGWHHPGSQDLHGLLSCKQRWEVEGWGLQRVQA